MRVIDNKTDVVTREEKIILAELEYWKRTWKQPGERTLDSEFAAGLYYGAVGSLSNVLAAIKLGRTAEQHEADLEAARRGEAI